ncbi:hypothetical protein [Streptococcus hyovaginalis]
MKKQRPGKIPKTPEQLKQEVKYKNTLFNRYMLFRYSLALLFFANVYWFLTLLFVPSAYLVLPIVMLLILVLATVEQFKLYGAKQPKLSHTALALKAQLGVQVLVVILVIANQTNIVFPTFSNQLAAKLMVVGLQVLGMLLVGLNLRKIAKIKQNKDHYYLRFQHIEKYI